MRFVLVLEVDCHIVREVFYTDLNEAIKDFHKAHEEESTYTYTLYRLEGDDYIDISPARPWEAVQMIENQFNSWFEDTSDGDEWKRG